MGKHRTCISDAPVYIKDGKSILAKVLGLYWMFFEDICLSNILTTKK